MRAQKRCIFLAMVLSLLVSALLPAQQSQQDNAAKSGPTFRREFTQAELLEDLQQLREALETNHPGMYDFLDKAAFDKRFLKATDAIRKTMTIEDFLKLAVPLVNDMGCGHSAMIPPAAYFQHAPGKFCPLQIRVLKGKMYLLRVFGGESPIPVGSEIVSINGEPSTDILEKLLPYIPADANLKATKLYKLEGFFYDAYTLLYDFPEKYEVAFIRPGGEAAENATLEAVAPAAIMMALGPERQKMFNLDFKALNDGSTAVMDINSFAFYKNEEQFKSFVDGSFKRIKDENIKNLIIDLRRNEGGDPYCTAHLLSYLISGPVNYYPADYPEYKPLTQPIAPAENRFAGSLYVLTDAGCFSATNHLCALLKYHGIGTLVGAETGGTYTCNSGIRGIELNNTRIRVGVATRRAAVVVEGLPNDRGIVPDHIVESTPEDITGGTDSVMETAIALIHGKQ